MKSTWKIAVAAVALTLVAQVVIGIAVIFSGAYDVAATVPHSAPVHWLLSTTTERSIAVRADDEPSFKPPPERLAGFKSYDAMCVQCHGAPGVQPSWLGKGIYPSAPDLAHVAKERTPEEIRAAIRRGIKFTAMPALEPTHSAKEIDELTSFVVALAEMSSGEYGRLKQGHAGETHEHGSDATDEHEH